VHRTRRHSGNCGQAPGITGITGWPNTAGDRPLTAASLAGNVVLVDFWTYSCINFQRSLPHIQAWYRSYSGDGFVVVGVHTPEFAFEHVTSNVRAQAASLGVKYPIAIDNNYATWQAFSNQYWPAEYLIDPSGIVRHVSFGEGDCGTTESLIRQLLTISHPGVALPAATDVPDTTPTEQQTPRHTSVTCTPHYEPPAPSRPTTRRHGTCSRRRCSRTCSHCRAPGPTTPRMRSPARTRTWN
jgi:thiol-disulfide isomerase/thioredoxin